MNTVKKIFSRLNILKVPNCNAGRNFSVLISIHVRKDIRILQPYTNYFDRLQASYKFDERQFKIGEIGFEIVVAREPS